jgi:hypothetical protein
MSNKSFNDDVWKNAERAAQRWFQDVRQISRSDCSRIDRSRGLLPESHAALDRRAAADRFEGHAALRLEDF